MTRYQDVPETVPEPEPDPPSQGPAPPPSVAPILVTIKKEQGQSQHLPPAGSVDNPMEIDDSGDDETVVQGSIATPKRRMKGACIISNLLAFLKLPTLVPPPGGESSGKRPKPASDHSSGSKDPTPVTTPNAPTISDKAAEFPKQPVRSLTEPFGGWCNLPFLPRSLHLVASPGSHTKTRRSKATGRIESYFMSVWINSAHPSTWIGAESPTTTQ